MTTVAEIQQVDALVKQLSPLTRQRQGELIRAEDWNTVVSALIDVAGILIALRAAGVPPHEHPDQVAIGWLDPRLRVLIEGGPLAEPAAQARLTDLERESTRATDALTAVRTELGDVRQQARDLANRDLTREASFAVVRRRVEGLGDARDAVADVRSTLDDISGRVDAAVELGRALHVDGEPIDVGGVVQRVDGLEALRERMTLPTGELLDAAGIQRRFLELAATFVTQEQLDEALKQHNVDLDEDQRAELVKSVTESVRGQLDEVLAAQKTDVTAEVDKRLSGIDGKVSDAVDHALPGVSDTISARVRDETGAQLRTAIEGVEEGERQRLQEAMRVLREEMGRQVDDLRNDLAELVRKALDEQLPPRLRTYDDMLAKLDERVTQLERGLIDRDSVIAGTNLRLDQLGMAQRDAASGLRTDLAADADRRTEALREELFENVKTAVAEATADEVRGLVEDQLAGFRDRLDDLVRKNVERITEDRIRKIVETVLDEREPH
jgi:hypothetical protein